MFKLLGNNYYSPTATEVAIEQRLSKLFLSKYHILNNGSICRLIIFFVVITSLLWKCKSTYLFLITEHFGKFFHFYPPPSYFSNALAAALHLQRNTFWNSMFLRTTVLDNLISPPQKIDKHFKDYLPQLYNLLCLKA